MIQKKKFQFSEIKKPCSYVQGFSFVGVAGFEPATSCSQSRRDDRTTLHPDFYLIADAKKKILYE